MLISISQALYLLSSLLVPYASNKTLEMKVVLIVIVFHPNQHEVKCY